MCVEDACQGNEICSSFSDCFLNGQCKKSAVEKSEQSKKWRLQQKQESPLHGYLLSNVNKSPLKTAGYLATAPASRKRLLSSDTSAILPVIAHMTNIQKSGNASWLNIKGTHGLENTIANMNLKAKKQDNALVSDSSKRTHAADTPTKSSQLFRSSVLYEAPQVEWRLTTQDNKENVTKPVKKLPESEDVEQELGEAIKDDWLLRKSPAKLPLEKAVADKENHVFLADRIKSQLSIATMNSIESIKEKIDRLNAETEKSSLDTVNKESWLLQQSSTQRADNKVLEEVMESKSEWLSNSSVSSFSIISEPDSRSSEWLMPPIL